MSANDSFAAALRNLGGIHTLPKPQPKDKSAKKKKKGAVKRGESGSSRQETEGTGNSSATPVLELQARGPELDSEALEVESPVLEPKKKRKKIDSSQKQVIDMTGGDPGKSAMEVVDLGVELEGGSRPAPKFGKYPVKKVIGLMSELPSDQDWEMMEDQGLVENFKEIGDLWGQVIFLSGFSFLSYFGLSSLFFIILVLLTRVRCFSVSSVVAWPGLTPMLWQT